MKNIITEQQLQKLAEQAYQTACDHGFHDKKLSDEHFLALIVSELSECVEADRRNDRSGDIKELFYSDIKIGEEFKEVFKSHIKDSLEDELADVVIRILDLESLRCMPIQIIPSSPANFKTMSFTESIYSVMQCCFHIYVSFGTSNISSVLPERLSVILGKIIAIADALDIDLMWHIDMKMKYNINRTYNKKY